MYHLITEPKLPSAITRMPTLQRDVVLYASTYARSSFMYHVSLVSMTYMMLVRFYEVMTHFLSCDVAAVCIDVWYILFNIVLISTV